MNYPNEGEFTFAFKSTQSEKQPERTNEGFLRSNVKLTGYQFKPAPKINGTRIEWI